MQQEVLVIVQTLLCSARRQSRAGWLSRTTSSKETREVPSPIKASIWSQPATSFYLSVVGACLLNRCLRSFTGLQVYCSSLVIRGVSGGKNFNLDKCAQLDIPFGEGHGNPLQYSCLENPMDGGPDGLLSMGSHRVGHDWNDLACMHTLEKEMAAHSSRLVWRIPGMEDPGGPPSVGSHRVRHDWSDLAAADIPCSLTAVGVVKSTL